VCQTSSVGVLDCVCVIVCVCIYVCVRTVNLRLRERPRPLQELVVQRPLSAHFNNGNDLDIVIGSDAVPHERRLEADDILVGRKRLLGAGGQRVYVCMCVWVSVCMCVCASVCVVVS